MKIVVISSTRSLSTKMGRKHVTTFAETVTEPHHTSHMRENNDLKQNMVFMKITE